MENEHAPLNADEQAAFKQLTNDVGEELQESRKPTDGWDPVPRPNPVDELIPEAERDDGRKYIPPGHIALQGGFDEEEKEGESST